LDAITTIIATIITVTAIGTSGGMMGIAIAGAIMFIITAIMTGTTGTTIDTGDGVMGGTIAGTTIRTGDVAA
jgi:hypothetical protein